MVVLDMRQFCLWIPHRGTAVVRPFRCSTCSTQQTKLTRPKQRLPRLPLGQVWWALVPTILYGLYDLHGNITGTIDGPYPFMRVYDQTIQETLMWFTIILVTNLLYAFLLWWLGGNGRKSKVGLEFRT